MTGRLQFPIVLLLGGIVTGGVGCGACIAPPVPLSDESIEQQATQTSQQASVEAALDPQLPGYEPVERLSGRITTVGSDTMNNLVALWVEGFKRFYPAVEFEVEAKGSSTAIPALIAGASTFGPMSRDPKPGEIDDFQAKFGYKPTLVPTCIDMLAVYVHRQNPIRSLTLPQVDAIFSQSRKLGYARDLTKWGELGLSDSWSDRTISLYGRNAASGTYGYFKDHVLAGGDFKDTVKEQPGSSSVVQAVGSELGAIGYSGIGYRTVDVRAVPLARQEGEPAVEPSPATAGEYPLARYLWLALNHQPGRPLGTLEREFIRFLLSREGQTLVLEDGYLPLPAEKAAQARQQVGID
jgi:phosphate transport system substrate-binding protein